MDEYILFIDETKKTSKNPYFCMSGLCFKRSYYENIVVPTINGLKTKHFGNTGVIFHYSDMNNKKNDFIKFKDQKIRQKFWTDYVNTVSKLDFTTEDLKKMQLCNNLIINIYRQAQCSFHMKYMKNIYRQ